MDIVFLRNVLIYFDLETKRIILRQIRRLLTRIIHVNRVSRINAGKGVTKIDDQIYSKGRGGGLINPSEQAKIKL